MPKVKARAGELIQKRNYSRKGCIECKRRKLKCDENKPDCLNCIKSLKDCSYKQIAKFSDSRTVILSESTFLVSKKPSSQEKKAKFTISSLIDNTDAKNNNSQEKASRNSKPDAKGIVPEEAPSSSNLSESGSSTANSHNKTELSTGTIDRLPYKAAPLIPQSPSSPESIIQETTSPSSLERILDKYDEYDQKLLCDASLLANGLNNIAMLDIFDDDPNMISEIDKSRIPVEFGRPQNLIADNDDDTKISNFILSHDLIPDHKNYLRRFYDKYSQWLFPCASSKSNICNDTLMLQALDFPFLLHAILSITARYENFCNPNSVDEYYQKYYLVLCCKGFSRIFDDKIPISRYVEPLILTTLLLVTDAVAFVNGDWRAHLKAAHKLFSKYVDIFKKKSPSILLATTWFAAFEILAVVANPLGGAISNEAEFDMMMKAGVDSDDIRLGTEVGLVLPNGFNVFLVYSKEAISMFITFVKTTLKIRDSGIPRAAPEDLILLMAEIKKANDCMLASEDCLIPKSNPYHPNNPTGMLLPIATYGYVNNTVFSWFDISHKIHVLALYLKLLVDKHFFNLPDTSDLVQDLVEEILSYCHFFAGIDFELQKFSLDEQLNEIEKTSLWLDRRMLTVHWPLLTCGLSALKRVHKLKIELYFRCMIKMGARSLKMSFKNVENKWNGGSGISDFVPFV